VKLLSRHREDVGAPVTHLQPYYKGPVIPAQAGIQQDKIPTKWDVHAALPASQKHFYYWIPACAGMTAS